MKINRLAPVLALAAFATLAVASPAKAQPLFRDMCGVYGYESLDDRLMSRDTCFSWDSQLVFMVRKSFATQRVESALVVTGKPDGGLVIGYRNVDGSKSDVWHWDGINNLFDPRYDQSFDLMTGELFDDIRLAGAIYKILFDYPYATP